MTTPIGTASITVEAVTDAFRQSLTTDTDRVLRQLRDGFEDTMTQIAASVTSASHRMEDAISRAADRMRDDIRESSRQIETAVQQSAQRTEDAFDRATTQLADNADRNADRIEQSFQDAATDIADAFRVASEDSAARIEDAMREMRADSERTADAIERDADAAGDAIGTNIAQGVAVASAALALLRDRANDALDGLGRGFGGVVGTITGMASSLGGLAATGVRAFTSISKAATAASLGVAALAQTLAAAAATMEQLAGVAVVAPAAILSFVSVTKTLTVAFQNVGDAISSLVSEDMEAFTEALNKLSPAAENAIIQMSSMLVQVKDLGLSIQDVFFDELADELETFGDMAFAVASRRLPQLSDALGEVAESFLRAATRSNLLAGVDRVLASTARGVEGLAAPLARLAPAFGDLFLVGSGFIDRMYASIGRLTDRFATFVTTAADTGELTSWVEEAIDGFQQIGRILGNLGGIFAELTSSASASGVGILSVLERVTEALETALGSDVGQEFLTSSFGLLSQVMESLSIVLGPLVELFAVFATGLAEKLTSALQTIEPLLRTVAGGIGDLSDALPGINESTRNLATQGLTMLFDAAVNAYDALRPLAVVALEVGSAFVDALAPVIPLFEDFAAGLSDIGEGFDRGFIDDLADSMADLTVGLTEGLLDVLDSVIEAFAELGKQLPELLPIIGQIASALGSVLGTAIDEVTSLFAPLTDILVRLAPALGPTANALRLIIEVAGGVARALAPVVSAFASMASGLAQVLNPAVNALRTTFRELEPLLTRAGEVIGQTLTASFEALRPGLEAIVTGFTSLLPKLKELAEPILQLIEIAAPLIELIATLAGELIERLAPYVFRVIGAMIDLRVVILDQLVPIFELLVTFLVDNLRPAFDELLPIVEAVFSGIASSVETAVAIVGPIFEFLREWLEVTLPFALGIARVGVQNAWDVITTVISTAWENIKVIFNIIKDVLTGDFAGAWRGLKEVVSNTFTAIWDLINRMITRIVEFLKGDAATKLYTAMWNAFKRVAAAVTDWFVDIGQSVLRGIFKIGEAFAEIPGLIFEKIGNLGSWMYDRGTDLIQGLINGVIEKAKDIPGMVKSWVVDPIMGALDVFSFGSPSKLMMQYGGWLSEGLADGIEGAESSVVAAAEAITRAATLPGMDTMSTGAPVPGIPAGATVGGAVAAGAGVVFGPGAVQVVFNGAVPSEREAYTTGAAVGAGIADELARRDARVSMGVL